MAAEHRYSWENLAPESMMPEQLEIYADRMRGRVLSPMDGRAGGCVAVISGRFSGNTAVG